MSRPLGARALLVRSAGLLLMCGSVLWAEQQGGAVPMPAAAQAAPVAGGQQMQMGGMTGTGRETTRRAKAEISTALTVTVEGRSETLTAQQLDGMPQRTVTVHNGHTNAEETYTGVGVSDLLAGMGVRPDAEDAHAAGGARQRLLRSFLRATGTDFYSVVYSGVELEPTMHAGDVIVATKRNGQKLGDGGALMLVSSEDKMPARWVRNLTSVTLSSID